MSPPQADRPPAGERSGAGERAGEPFSGAPGPRGGGPDPLDELSQRVRAAQEAAERILEEAGRAREGAGDRARDRPPASGYSYPRGSDGRRSAEAQAVVALLELGRALVPPELRHALSELVRELLLLLRALIDWYLERLEQRRRAPVEVEDIPIT